MKTLCTSICLGLGDNLVARMIFDTIKHEYDQIRISHNHNIIRIYKNGDSKYIKFINDIGNLLFTEPPYYFDHVHYTPINTLNAIQNLNAYGGASPPNLQSLLCRGAILNINEEYIVITTKIRGISKTRFYPLLAQFLDAIRHLSKKYKIVIMGERIVEVSTEYKDIPNIIIGIYNELVAAIPPDRAIDLTVPALGIAAPELSKIQQDAMILQQAKFAITLGLGGNVWLAVASAPKIIGYRDVMDNDTACDLLLTRFSNTNISKDWNQFIAELKGS